MKKLTTILSTLILTLTTLSVSMPAQAIDLGSLFGSSTTTKFLSVDQAFKVNTSVQGNKIRVTFDITEEHYVYRDKLKIKLPNGVTASKFHFDKKPYFVEDPNFGQVAVFDDSRVTATATLKNNTNANISFAPATIQWQGCAKAGLCYPPEKIKTEINLKKK